MNCFLLVVFAAPAIFSWLRVTNSPNSSHHMCLCTNEKYQAKCHKWCLYKVDEFLLRLDQSLYFFEKEKQVLFITEAAGAWEINSCNVVSTDKTHLYSLDLKFLSLLHLGGGTWAVLGG